MNLARNRDVVEPGELVLGFSSVPAAHSLKLIRICAGANIVNRGRGKGRVEEERYDVLESCQFQRYLRIRADRAEINANVAMLFANGVCERDLPRDSSMPSDLVMICQWA